MTSSPPEGTPQPSERQQRQQRQQHKPRPSQANLDEAWQDIVKGTRKPTSKMPVWYFRVEYSVSAATVANMKKALAKLDRAGVSPVGSWAADRATAQSLIRHGDTSRLGPLRLGEDLTMRLSTARRRSDTDNPAPDTP